MTVAESLKRFRKAHKLTQSQVAESLNCSQQMYQYYEAKGELPANKILTIATTYNVSTDYLLGLTDEPNPAKGAADNSKLQAAAELLNQVLSERGLKV